MVCFTFQADLRAEEINRKKEYVLLLQLRGWLTLVSYLDTYLKVKFIFNLIF